MITNQQALFLATALWTILTGAGTVYGIKGVKEAWIDQATLLDSGVDGPRRMLARGYVRREILLLLVQALFFLSGLMVLVLPRNPVLSWAVRMAFITGGALLLSQQVLNVLERRHFLRR